MKLRVGDKVNLVNALLAVPVPEHKANFKGEIAYYTMTKKECDFFGYKYSPTELFVEEIKPDGTIIIRSNRLGLPQFWQVTEEFLEKSDA